MNKWFNPCALGILGAILMFVGVLMIPGVEPDKVFIGAGMLMAMMAFMWWGCL